MDRISGFADTRVVMYGCDGGGRNSTKRKGENTKRLSDSGLMLGQRRRHPTLNQYLVNVVFACIKLLSHSFVF